MKSSPPSNILQITNFLQLDNSEFIATNKVDAYRFIINTVKNIRYSKLKKKEKGFVNAYLCKLLGYSAVHTKRLLILASKKKLSLPKTTKNRTSFQKKYTQEDQALLAEYDSIANYPNGYALKASFLRMYQDFKDDRFCRLATISVGHIYNLRKTSYYRKLTLKYEHPKPISDNLIGIREKPVPDNRPGFIRVDSVHGGDRGKDKGVYYVNLVDEVTQMEVVICVKGISERFLAEIWPDVLASFPFRIINFHSDNGSEFINKMVAEMLNKLGVRQTKSRPRHSNDNGLVETKNGWIIRKHFGYLYYHKDCAIEINQYLQSYFNNFLNYHRPCAFPEKIHLSDGKVKTVYRQEKYKTPYDKLKEVDPEGTSLHSNTSYPILDKIAYEHSDYDYLKIMKKEYQKMLKLIVKKTNQLATVSASFYD